jgi:hypothetical protein
MRPNQNMKRSRGRGRNNKPHHNMANRTLESNGPDVKIRGTAQHIYEKYLQLARDANSTGDRVVAESYLQHAEHYFRQIVAAQGQQPQFGGGGQHQHPHHQGNGSMNGRQPNGSGEQPNVPGFQGLPGPSFQGEEPEGDDGDDDGDDTRN